MNKIFIHVMIVLLFVSAVYADGTKPYSGPLPYLKITPNSENIIHDPITLDDVIVTASELKGTEQNGYRTENSQLGFFNEKDAKTIPFSISTVSGELIKNIGADDPEMAMIAEPTVSTLMSSAGYSSMDRVQIRGFNASDQNTLRNGMVDRSFTMQPLDDIDQIIVLHGLSGFLYGFSSIGGTVDYITRLPQYTSSTEISIKTTDTLDTNILFDITGPINKKTPFRLTFSQNIGETYLDNSDIDRTYFSGEIDHNLTDTSYLTFGFYYQYLKQEGIPSYFNIQKINYVVPDALDATTQYGEDWTYNEAEKYVFDITYHNDITSNLTLRLAARYADMNREYSFIGNTFINSYGDYTKTYVDSSGNDETATAGYALIDYDFNLLNTDHTITFGYTHSGFTFRRGANYIEILDGIYNINNVDYNPTPIKEASGYDRKMKSLTHNIVLGDDIKFGKFDLMAGVNYSILDLKYYGAYASDPNKPSKNFQNVLTPMIGLSYNIVNDWYTYCSYMEGVEQGGIAPSSANNAYDVLDPMISKQYEIGVKNTWFNSFDTSLSLFRIEKTNQYTDPNDNTYKQDGEEVHQGIEFLTSGKIKDLTVIGGVSYVDAEIKKASNALTEGESPVNIPEIQAKLHMEYTFDNIFNKTDLTLFGGVNYFGKRPVNIPNTSYIDGADVYHTGIRLRYDKYTTVSLIATNLFDKQYWSYYRSGSDGMSGDDGLFLGSPRTITLMVTRKF